MVEIIRKKLSPMSIEPMQHVSESDALTHAPRSHTAYRILLVYISALHFVAATFCSHAWHAFGIFAARFVRVGSALGIYAQKATLDY